MGKPSHKPTVFGKVAFSGGLRIRYGSHHQQQQKYSRYDEFDLWPT
jgi:hypothetical protein